MRTVNIDELTRKLNTFRMEHLNNTFMSSELKESLYYLGFNRSVVSKLIKVFPFEDMGGEKLYGVPKDPIPRTYVNSLYEKYRQKAMESYYRRKNTSEEAEKTNEEVNEEKALEVLLSKGYQIKKLIGFDTARLQKENPEIYQKYLLYKLI